MEQALADDASYAAALLAGEMPPEIEEVFAGLGLALFPEPGATDLSMDCTCPDSTVPCKHLAAVFYLLAERFDADPFEMLALRGRDRETLLDEPARPAWHRPPRTVRTRRAVGVGPAAGRVLDRFWTSPPVDALPPAPPATSPDAVLDQVPELPVRVRGKRVTELLRPAYRRMADEA